MEFFLIISLHFLVMGTVILMVSGMVSYFVPPRYEWLIVLVSMLIGYLYTYVSEVPGLALFATLFNGSLSLVAIGVVNIGLHIRQRIREFN